MVLLIVNWHLELPQFLAVHQYYDSLNIIIRQSVHWSVAGRTAANRVVCLCSELCLPPVKFEIEILIFYQNILMRTKTKLFAAPNILQLTATEPVSHAYLHIPSVEEGLEVLWKFHFKLMT